MIAVIEGTEEAAKVELPQSESDLFRESTAAIRKSGPRRTVIVKTEKQGVTMTELQNMLHVKRITILTPQHSLPLLNQELSISSKIKQMGLKSTGTCTYKVKVEKDVLFPNEAIKLEIFIDNSNCTKKVDFYKIKLLKRT